MQRYYDCSAGCIYGECFVMMADRSVKKVKYLEKGDLIMQENNEPAKIKCVLKTNCLEKLTKLVYFEDLGLKITPWHPVKINEV